MIWLSPMTGTKEGSVYFHIRDIAWQHSDNECEGLIRGLLGDGQREICAEVQLGKQTQVRIIPVWTEAGELESLSADIDEELLKEQLLKAVQRFFTAVSNWSDINTAAAKSHLFDSEPKESCWLAA